MALSEDVYVKKIDECLYDSVVKIGAGIFLGGLTSILFLKRKRWPILVGSGFGLGYAYANCEQNLRNVLKPAQ